MQRTTFDSTLIVFPQLRQFLAEHPGEYRILNVWNPNTAMSLRAFDAWGYDPGVTRRYAEFIDWSEGGDPDRATNYVTFRRFHPLLAMLRVKYVVVVENGVMTIHPGAIPPLRRLELVGAYQIHGERAEILRAMGEASFDPRKEVILEREPHPAPVAADTQGIARIFRERENIPALLHALEQALAGLDWETIVVVDDAFDGTEDLVRERAQRDPRVRCIQRIGRRGLASACIEGMLASSAPYLAVIDADLQHDETLVPQLLAKARREEADVAVASRYMAGGSTGELAPNRVPLSRLGATLSATLCEGLTDPTSGFFVVRRTFLDRVVRNLYGRGFKILLDLIAAARGKIRIVELPCRMRSRAYG